MWLHLPIFLGVALSEKQSSAACAANKGTALLQHKSTQQLSTPRWRLLLDSPDVWAGSDSFAWRADGVAKEEPSLLQVENNKTWLQLVGMFDSGTNLLGATLEQNLGTTYFRSVCPCGDEGYHCHFWKHLDTSLVAQQLQQASDDGIKMVLLCMVRSPLAQLISWQKAPYDISACVDAESFEHDAERTCTIPQGGGTYHGLVEVWNNYTHGYSELAKQFPQHVVKTIEYERLVIEPEAVMSEVAAALNVSFADASFSIVTDAAKKHGDAHGRADALKEIMDMTYLENPELKADVKDELCSRLNQEELRAHVLKIDGEERSYEADCANTSVNFTAALFQRWLSLQADSE